MTDFPAELGSVTPTLLTDARRQAHYAVQWVSRAARANLPSRDDDSHSNLGWEAARGALVSHDLAGPGGPVRVGLAMGGMVLHVDCQGDGAGELPLDGHSDIEAGAWLDERLGLCGLQPAGLVALPYDLENHALGQGAGFTVGSHAREFAELAAWFATAADILETVRATLGHISPGPGPVRCWPHHFDIATLLSLEEGDPETARAIGIGMSPGDGTYEEPYFYINPWPHLAPDDLPDLPPPGHWHTEGFVGAVATASEALTLAERRNGLVAFVAGAVEAGRQKFGL